MEQLIGSHNTTTVIGKSGKHHRFAARSQDELISGDDGGLTCRLYTKRMWIVESGPTLYAGDLTLAHKILDTLHQAIHHAFGARYHGWEVYLHVSDDDAVFCGLLYGQVLLNARHQRLSGNASSVKACAADFITLDQTYTRPQLRCTNGSHISARAGSYYSDVKMARFHASTSLPYQSTHYS